MINKRLKQTVTPKNTSNILIEEKKSSMIVTSEFKTQPINDTDIQTLANSLCEQLTNHCNKKQPLNMSALQDILLKLGQYCAKKYDYTFISTDNQILNEIMHLFIYMAKEKNNVEAAFQLGRLYDSFDKTEDGKKNSFKYYLKAAMLGHAEAMDWTGTNYLFGDGVKKCRKAAIQWYRNSVKAGNFNACYTLGCLENDKTKAKEYFLLGANRGIEDCIWQLAEYYRNEILTVHLRHPHVMPYLTKQAKVWEDLYKEHKEPKYDVRAKNFHKLAIAQKKFKQENREIQVSASNSNLASSQSSGSVSNCSSTLFALSSPSMTSNISSVKVSGDNSIPEQRTHTNTPLQQKKSS